ncbi:hypothetical protein K8O68_10260 [Salipaludibacillus sp. CUR1]|uniref:hypothetical protein n=1 Tax=Salipaludibacillus sp. CUR1 TaxID=2820003 RepID=UPI001E2B97AA|nr:hypothetical protein [Salipaludibacillus sp. CUR1]MCE7792798.1 hypothetical protein [Salipaludibacillus sp. CUR1]
MQVKRSNCGFEQFVKDVKFNREYRDSYEKSFLVLCGRNECDKSQIKGPNGYIREMMWFGSWSTIREATLEEYRSVKRARTIRDMGVEQWRKQ